MAAKMLVALKVTSSETRFRNKFLTIPRKTHECYHGATWNPKTEVLQYRLK